MAAGSGHRLGGAAPKQYQTVGDRTVLRHAIDNLLADPRVAGRLALWGRRLVGEALSQAQRVAADRDALSALLVGGADRPGVDLAEIGRMLARLTDNHTRRMQELGLAA